LHAINSTEALEKLCKGSMKTRNGCRGVDVEVV
jgi:hypothetical protein